MTKLSIKVVGLAFVVALLSPQSVLALTPTLNLTTPEIKIEKPVIKLPADLTLTPENTFCADFDETKETLAKRVEEERGKVDAYLTKLTEDTENYRNQSDAKLEEQRSKADQKRGELYLRLEGEAEGDNEEDAVEEFRESVEDAVEARRAAIDAARTEFRAGVDTLLATRKKDMESARDAFQSSVTASLTKTEDQCNNGGVAASIKKTLQNNLKNARMKLAGDKQSSTKLESGIKALQETRDEKIATAVETFQKTLALAQSTLKQVMNQE